MTCLFDTSALLIHHRGEPGAEQVQKIFDQLDIEVLIASVSLAELARRLREFGAPVEEIEQVVQRYRRIANAVVAVDAEVAMASYELICQLPRRLPLVDALISAAARSRGAVLVHRDKHMRAIPSELLTQIDLEAPATA